MRVGETRVLPRPLSEARAPPWEGRGPERDLDAAEKLGVRSWASDYSFAAANPFQSNPERCASSSGASIDSKRRP